jgi:hypothetical protein
MAKKISKKATPKSAPEKAAPPAAAKPARTDAPPKALAKSNPTAAPSVTSEAIGYAAGDVWGALHGKGWQSLAAVKKASGAPSDLTLMAIGWLAREGKLDFAASGKTVKLTLK